ncbi:metal-sensitive transcriptional regulator [Patescibacteria group bacterium]|nr:metal-sensitive transcriptional regulator [Patescibacteria group bacterium]
MQSCDIESIKKQINRSQGQVNGINKMIESGRDCLEIVQQIAAVRASLGRLATMLLEQEAQGCFDENSQDKLKNLNSVVTNLFKFN